MYQIAAHVRTLFIKHLKEIYCLLSHKHFAISDAMPNDASVVVIVNIVNVGTITVSRTLNRHFFYSQTVFRGDVSCFEQLQIFVSKRNEK